MRLSDAAHLRMLAALAGQAGDPATPPKPAQAMLAMGLNGLAARMAAETRLLDETRREIAGFADDLARLAPALHADHGAALDALAGSDDRPAPRLTALAGAFLTLLDGIAAGLGSRGAVAADGLPLLAAMAAREQAILMLRGKSLAAGTDATDGDPLPFAAIEAAVAASESPPAFVVTSLEPISGGMSKTTFMLAALVDGEERGLVVKQCIGPPLVELDCMEIGREFDMLAAIAPHLPFVPKPLWLGRDVAGSAGDFAIMARCAGGSSASFLTLDSPLPEALLRDIAAHIARIHAVPSTALGAFADRYGYVRPERTTVRAAVLERLEGWRQAWLGFDRTPSPVEDYLFAWLKANAPANDAPPALIHGDMTPHNCLWIGESVTAVLDWECAHFGDPAEDLAYIRMHVEQRIDWRAFLDHYWAAGGVQFDPAVLDYYTCYLNFRTVLLANVMVTAGERGHSLDPRLMMIDRDFTGMLVSLCLDASRRHDARAADEAARQLQTA